MNDERAPTAEGEEQLNANHEGSVNSAEDTFGGCEETKKPKVDNPRELDNARYAALMSRAHSDQARALVETVTNLVAMHELAAGTRTNKRKKKQDALRSAMERLLADLL